ncbi:MAG: hypothetical protein ACSNEK_02820 [Parachlamydiaceae bacterium]
MNAQQVFWTSIKPELMRKTLIEGTCIAGIGVFLLLLAATIVPPQALEKWGLLIFILAAILMTAGLVPYRLLQRLELAPNKIYLNDDHTLCYLKKNQLKLSIPFKKIGTLEWVDQRYIYGIKIKLCNQQSIFLPFFSHRSFQEIRDIIFSE